MPARKKIVYQGEPGANSHLACQQVYPRATSVPCPTFEDCFIAVENGDADLAMIPIENSVAGRVADMHHLMPKSGLHIIGEHFQPVRHQLLGVKGAALEDIKIVHSHVHALGQCRKVIRDLGVEPRVHADTAGAAKMVAEKGDKAHAAIASSLAADIYDLNILRTDIEDARHNTTRFLIMAPDPHWPVRGPSRDKADIITSFLFEVRSVPAALYKAMGGFATNGVNMTKLESYQKGASFAATMFFADIEGAPGNARVDTALEELAFQTNGVRLLGSYAQARPRG